MKLCCPNCQSVDVIWRKMEQCYTCENCHQEFFANKDFKKQKHWREYREEAFSLFENRHYEQAAEIMQQGAIVAKKDFGNGSIEYAEAIAELGYIFGATNKINEAIPYLKQLLIK